MSMIKNLLIKYKELILYMIFGVGTTVVNIVSFWIFTRIIILNSNNDINIIIANVIAWILSVLFAYITNKIWVFNSFVKGTEMLKEAFAFFSCRFASLIMDIAIVSLGVSVLHYPDMPVKLVSNVFVIIFNYVFSKFFIFKQKENAVK